MAKHKRGFIIGIILGVIVATLVGSLSLIDNAEAPAPPQATEQKPQPKPSVFNKALHSLDDPNSPWVIINKKRPLPPNYAPADLVPLVVANTETMRAEAAQATAQLIEGAKKSGHQMKIISSFRSYQTQAGVYNGYVRKDGQAAADTYSARPGFSEHQTGLAADLGLSDGRCDLEICFGGTDAGRWLDVKAHEYGFIIRYPSGKESVTGYQYEPWHIRYVGKDLAKELKNKKQTMEEFFGLPPAPSY